MAGTSLQYLPNQKQCWPYSFHTVTKLEIFTYICCVPLGLLHFFAPENLIGLVIPGSLFLITAFCWHYFGGLQFKLFKKYMLNQFRTLVVLFSLFMIVLLHTLSYFILLPQYRDTSANNDGDPTYPIIIAIFDDIFWCLVILVLIEGDTIYPKPSNLSRFILPAYATVNCIVSIYNANMNAKYDVVFISYSYGAISYWSVWQAAFFQLGWFLFTIAFAVFRDPKHLLCTWATVPVLRKRYLTNIYYHKYTKFTKTLCGGVNINITFPTYVLLIVICILAIPVILLYVIAGASNKNEWWEAEMLIVLTTLLLLLLFILMYSHFEWHLTRKLLKQFRCQLLLISIGLLTYTMIQKIVWNANGDKVVWGGKVIVCDICFHIAYYIAVMIMIVRDGIIYTFPWVFTMICAIVLCILSIFNILRNTFSNQVIIYPSWFLFIEKEAYFQIASMMVLIIWKLVRDRNHTYFVLIRQHLKRKVLFKSLDKSLDKSGNESENDEQGNNYNYNMQLIYSEANDTELDNDNEDEVFPSYYKQDTFLMQQNV